MKSFSQLFNSFYVEKMAFTGKNRIPSEVRSPPLPPGLISRTSNRLVKITKNITIEPALFIMAFCSSMESIASSQMVAIKSCKNDFGYNDTVCYNLDSEEYHDQNVEVSIELNHFNVYTTWISSIFPIFFSFYLGAWADLFGRKPLFYLYLITYTLKQCVYVVCAYYFDSKKEYLLLANIPTALSGGWGVYMLAMNAFIADITLPEDRAFRYGMMHLASSLGHPLGSPFGAWLLRTTSFLCVFCTALVGIAIGSAYLLYRINAYKWNPPKTDKKKRNTFSLFHIWDAFKAAFRRRAGPNRRYLLLLMLTYVTYIMPFFGEYTVAFSYVRIRYSWGVDEYSTYSSVVSSASIVAQAIFMPLMSVLKINEAWIMAFCFSNLIARHIVKGFASEPWMYYLGALIDIVGSYAGMILKSMLSCCVAPDELGKIYALLSAVDNLLPLGITEGYSLIFEATIESNWPGTIFFISAAISGLAVMSSLYILISLKGKRMSEVTAAGAGHEENKKSDVEISDINTVISYM